MESEVGEMIRIILTGLLDLGRLGLEEIFMKLTLSTVMRKGLSALLALILKTVL